MNKNTNDGKYVNSLLYKSRLLFIFLFCLVQNTKGQMYLSEGASLYSDKEIQSLLSDSLVSNQDSKIYISSGVVISNNDVHRNYEVEEITSSEKKKSNPAQQLALKTTETKLDVSVESKKVSVADQPVASTEFSTQESEFSFGFSSGLSKIVVPASQSQVKPILGSKHHQTSLSFKERRLALVYFKNAELLKSQNKSSFSVRPPPFLV